MTSRQRVEAALDFATPDRVPRDIWALPWVQFHRAEQLAAAREELQPDIDRGPEVLVPGDRSEGRKAREGYYTDEWGSVWHAAEDGVIGEVCQPALADWADLDRYAAPWEVLQRSDWDAINRRQQANLAAENPKYLLPLTSIRPFERIQFIRGTENVFLDLAYGTAELRTLLEMLNEYYLAELDKWLATDVDGIYYMDDWGSQQALLISPDAWEDLFAPLYVEYNRRIHAAGKKAFFHSDGHIAAIFGRLIECGFDAINSQLFCMDIEQLGRDYKGKVTFWGEIDRQQVLAFGTPDDVRAAVRRVCNALGDRRGGLIAQCEWGKDVSIENLRAVFQGWAEAGG